MEEINSRVDLMAAVHKYVESSHLKSIYMGLNENQQQKLFFKYQATKSNPEDIGWLIYKEFVQ